MYFAYNQLDKSHFPYKKVIIMDKTSNISTLTTIGIDRQTGKLIDKLCKRYSLKKGEIVRLAFVYIDKACINPSEAPESVKSELSKINKRQDDIIRFIRHYEEEQLNPMGTNGKFYSRSLRCYWQGVGKPYTFPTGSQSGKTNSRTAKGK